MVNTQKTNSNINSGGWKGNLGDIDRKSFNEVFKKICNSSEYSEVLECFNSNSYSTEEILKKSSVNEKNLR